MTRVAINDTALGAKLMIAEGPVELYDQQGAVVGQFMPAPRGLLHPGDDCPHDEAELKRRYREETGRPLADIWKSLGQT